MSSNHRVQDFQEPALLIADGEKCSQKLVDELLAWGPFVLMLDGAVRFSSAYKIFPDAVLGDFDDHFDAKKFVNPEHTKIIEAPNQNKTDLEKGLDYLISLGIHSVNIIWANGQRTDHVLNNYSSYIKYKKDIQIAIIDDYCKSYFLPNEFKKYYPKGSKISLIPAWQAKQVCTSGLKYDLDDAHLELGQKTSSSNESAKDGFVQISFSEGNILLIECQD
ncbi:MAG: thiamine diphosphokinase [Bacteroidetes bacterium MED-G17]|nr:MAG: thiamine diphosphokinase [Bacteroidetes bacterium TMED39]PDH53339.1 MAG: thiamine diphosphokinase [Bacteroidetes bacterium MED-G17]|tara:strand:- start:9645 stop:10304 length:660 start_codon:yes stop_codon:yes gene_type:complete